MPNVVAPVGGAHDPTMRNVPTVPRGLVGLQGLPAREIAAYLARAEELEKLGEASQKILAGRRIALLFFEDSTRTRTSFVVAAQRLGASIVDLSSATSSVNKGETLIDTARNVEAMGVHAFVVRARQSGAACMLASAVETPVINAGDGRHEHPTQGLLDILTIARSHRRDSFDLSGLRIAYVGDVASSRVARSGIAGLTALGAKVVCIGPPAMVPAPIASLGVEVSRNLDAELPSLDAVVMLRIQFERHDEGAKGPPAEPKKSSPIASIREYRACFGLSAERTQRMKPGAIVMHPGPINRGIELDADVADGPRSWILRQVAHGVLVRMAALERWAKA